ncbi:MAG: hypothetical protein Q4P14_03370, partial [Methanobacteriaceae archaeon]|nr:hypothetical protein [Methanobacteriaceae archaeon]
MVFNKKNIIFVLLLSVVLFCAVSGTWAADMDVSDVNTNENIGLYMISDDTILVDSLSDTATKNFIDIQDEIDNATSGATINLMNTTYYGNGTSILVNKCVTINGNGATLDAQNLSRIFEVTAQGVTFKDITFINGNALACLPDIENIVNNGKGGAILFNIPDCDSDEGYIVDCTFINNMAFQGGAVFLGNVSYSTFINNKASVAVDNETWGSGGAVYNVFASNCKFINNTAAEYGNSLCDSTAINCIIDGDNNDVNTIIKDIYYLTVKDSTMYITETGYIEAYLEDGWGNPLEGKTIIFGFDEEDFENYTLGNATTNSKGIAIFELSEVPESFIGFAKSSEESNVASFQVTVLKIPVNINVESYTATYGDTINLTVNVTDKDGNLVESGIITFDGNKVALIDGVATYQYFCSPAGNNTVLVYYTDSIISDLNNHEVYDDDFADINVSVNPLKVDLNISIIGNDSYKCSKVQIETLNSSLMNNVPVTLVFTDANGVTVLTTNVAIKNGVGTYTIPLVPSENYTVTALINDSNIYADSVNATFNVTALNFDLSVSAPNSYYKGGKITVKLLNYPISDDVTVKLVFSNGKTADVVCKNGVGTYTLQFVPGTYNVSAYVNN